MTVFISPISGIGGPGQHKLCHKQIQSYCANSHSTNSEIHDICLSWKVSDKDTLFQKPMRPTTQELQYHQLEFTDHKLEKAKMFCGKVRAA